jgi:hypothetical protein
MCRYQDTYFDADDVSDMLLRRFTLSHSQVALALNRRNKTPQRPPPHLCCFLNPSLSGEGLRARPTLRLRSRRTAVTAPTGKTNVPEQHRINFNFRYSVASHYQDFIAIGSEVPHLSFFITAFPH